MQKSLDLIWEINPDIDQTITFEEPIFQNYTPSRQEKDQWLIWFLDSRVNPLSDKVWAFSCRPQNFTGTSFIDKGTVMPQLDITINPSVPIMNFDIDKLYPAFWQFSTESGWKLDQNYCEDDKEIYLIKFKPKWRDVKNFEWIGVIQPEIITEYNPDLPKVRFKYDDCKIPLFRYLNYEHIWYLKNDKRSKEKIWAFKKYAKTGLVKKDMGETEPIIPEKLDVFFLSYYEPNAEINWQRLKQIVPYAKRVDGVTGIGQAHRIAATQAETDMFYVVDADAYIVDDFNFDFQPGIFDRDCTHIWYAQNPINGLIYGYGGVKLFSKFEVLKLSKWITLDYSTKVSKKLKVMEQVSNLTNFNTDAFSTWRSAFRECTKLIENIKNGQDIIKSKERLDVWLTEKGSCKFGHYAVIGAQDAVENYNSIAENNLLQINDRTWLKKFFDKKYHE